MMILRSSVPAAARCFHSRRMAAREIMGITETIGIMEITEIMEIMAAIEITDIPVIIGTSFLMK